jgi:ergothioneine biosynthesis protein EgtB
MTWTAAPQPLAQPKIEQLFRTVRSRTLDLVEPLSAEDMMLQSMEDASPAKWHLAHTTWFFEEFILKPNCADYTSPDDRFAVLFNSYYVQAGPRHARDQRGLLSRPPLDDVLSYRAHVEDRIAAMLETRLDDIAPLVELGCHHEMQHQELLVTDLLHGLSHNPLLPAYRDPVPLPVSEAPELNFMSNAGGQTEIGHSGPGFAFDCETPRHTVFQAPFSLANRPVTNRDWIEFIDDGGYDTPTLWLMDGWAERQKQDWTTPLYWWRQDDEWWSFTLRGAQPVALDAPVVHVSYYEADAFARWAQLRLPTETESEIAARDHAIEGNFAETDLFRPRPGTGVWGDVWEWTSSAYAPYPGFRPSAGAIGEYNGKFMINQMVLRGGSCATPQAQMRPSYRTFFYPHQRWQMMGLRLARDV